MMFKRLYEGLRVNFGGLHHLHWIHWSVVIVSLYLTFLAWDISKTQIQLKNRQRFDFQSDQLVQLVVERMQKYEDALRSGVATMASHEQNMSIEHWRQFSESLELDLRYQGILGIGVIFYVAPSQREEFIEQQRRSRPDFHIHPEHGQNEYWPITYIEPEHKNRKAVGLDMAFEYNRFTAAKKARDRGSVQITEPIILVQDAKKTPGFLQFVPIYTKPHLRTISERREHFIGHVYAPYIVQNLMLGTLKQSSRNLLFSVHDGEIVLFNELSEESGNVDSEPLFKKEISVEMFGRFWRFNIASAKSFRSSTYSNQPRIVLFCGIVIDALLLTLFVSMSKVSNRAVNEAKVVSSKLDFNEHYYRHIIESSPCGMIMVNASGEIELINKQVEILFGYSREELLGSSVDKLVPADVRTAHAEFRSQFEDSDTRLMGRGREIFGLHSNGNKFPAELGISTFRRDDYVQVLVTVFDMSAHYKIMDELRRSNKELNDFAYVASHDLKTPLRGIMQLSNWIEEDIELIASENAMKHLGMLKGRVLRLERLLDDLLSYSRIERAKAKPAKVSIEGLVTEVFSMQQVPETFVLNIEGELPVFDTYSAPLEQIFRNLIDNAIKHFDGDYGVVTVRSKDLGDEYSFEVADNGEGIPERYRDSIFQIFHTLRPRDNVEGSGMGLAIIKKQLEYYGKHIVVEGNQPKGSIFRFTWPKNISL